MHRHARRGQFGDRLDNGWNRSCAGVAGRPVADLVMQMVVDGPSEIGQGVDCLIDLGALM